MTEIAADAADAAAGTDTDLDAGVRTARAHLAGALARAQRRDEALEQLRSALDEPGDDPTDATLHRLIGDECRDAGDSSGALDAYLRSVIADPTLGEPAAAAVRMLAQFPPAPRWQDMVARVVAAVRRSARPAAEASLLAAQLARRDHDLASAADLYARSLAARSDPDVVRQLVDTWLEHGDTAAAEQALTTFGGAGDTAGLRARIRLEAGAPQDALALARGASDDTAVATAAFAHIALDRPVEALALTGEAATTERAVAATIAHLALRDYPAARTSLAAITTTPSAAALLQLLRVQILLEAAEGTDLAEGTRPFDDIDEARSTLERIDRADSGSALRARLLRHSWFRLQQETRGDDDRWRYAYAEMVCGLGELPYRARAAIDACPRSTTTYLQDAALQELTVRFADPDDVEAYGAAIDAARDAVDGRGDTVRALRHAELAARTAPTIARACAMAELVWRMSFSEVLTSTELEQLVPLVTSSRAPAAPDAAALKRALLEDAVERIDTLSDELISSTDRKPAYRYGLCLARLGEMDEASGTARQWAAAPYLLAAALGSDDGFIYANAARVLDNGNASAGAYACAVRARELEPDDSWIREVELLTFVGFSGAYDDLAPLLDRYDESEGADLTWSGCLRYLCAVLSGRASSVAEPGDSAPEWIRPAVLFTHGVERGVPACREDLAAFVAEASAQVDPEGLATACRCLGRFDDADRVVLDAERENRVTTRARVQASALTDLARQGDQAESELARLLSSEQRPVTLRYARHAELPLVAAVTPEAAPAVQRLIDLCDERLAVLDATPPSPLADLQQAPNGYVDGTGLLAPLLNLLFAERNSDWTEASRLLRELTDATAGAMLRAALRADIDALASRAATAMVDRLTGHVAQDDDGWLRALDQLAATEESAVARAWGAAAARLAETGDEQGAAHAIARSVDRPQSVDPAGEALAGAVATTDGYLAAVGALARVAAGLAPETHEALKHRLLERLGQLLHLNDYPADSVAGVVTPIVIEVGDRLVPHVDPAQLAGDFFDEVIPAFKERVLDSTGVALPGIRLRPSYAIEPMAFVVLIDDVPIIRGEVPSLEGIAVVAAPGVPPPPGTDVVRYHPATGERGVWQLSAAVQPPASPVSVQRYLLAALEVTVRARLARFMGPDAMAARIAVWRESDAAMVDAVVGDELLRLTWLVQDALEDGVDVADWRGLLAAIAAAGGVTAAPLELRDALARTVRVSSHDGPLIDVPAQHRQALAEHDGPIARHGFLVWVRETVAEHGPAITLVTQDHAQRRRIDQLVRTEHSLIITVTADQVVSP